VAALVADLKLAEHTRAGAHQLSLSAAPGEEATVTVDEIA